MRPSVLCFSLVLLVGTATRPVESQVHFGPQLSIGTDSGVGLGARAVFPLSTSVLGLDGSLDGNYFFGGGAAVDSWIDANLNVRLPLPLASDFDTQIGAGVNAAFISLDSTAPSTETNTEFGFNLLAKVGLPEGNLAPFLELRVVVGGAEQVVVSGGFTVGPRR